MKKIILFLSVFLLLNFVCAEQMICVDFDSPSAPLNLEVTSSGTNIILNWESATDEPNCSGVDYYNVAIDGNIIAEHIIALIYTDINVPYGTYSYSVWAVDKVGHNSGPAIKNDVVLSEPTGGGDTTVGGGGGGTSYICKENWQCTGWPVCANGIQTRTCQDLNKCGTTILKPVEELDCKLVLGEGTGESTTEQQTLGKTTEGKGFFLGITGAVTGALGNTGWLIIIIFILGIIGLSLSVRLIRKRKANIETIQ